MMEIRNGVVGNPLDARAGLTQMIFARYVTDNAFVSWLGVINCSAVAQ